MWAAMVTAIVVVAGARAAAGETHRWTVAAYLSGDGDLRATAERYMATVAAGANQPGWAAAVQIDKTGEDGQCGAGRHAWTWSEGQRRLRSDSVPGSEAGVNMGARETLAGFLQWVRQQAPAERYALIVMGHGTGLTGWSGDVTRGLTSSGVALDTSAGGDCLSVSELAGGIEDGFERPREPGLDALFLDCCYGSSLEVAYELRGGVRYMTAVPGELPNPGLPWQEILSRAGRQEAAGGRELVRICLQVVAEHNRGQDRPASVTGIDLGALGRASERIGSFVRLAETCMPEMAPAITLAHSQAATWGSQRELCDAAGLLAGIAEHAGERGVALAAQAAAEAVQASVIGRVGELSDRCRGMGVFFPGKLTDLPDGYDGEAYSFTGASGWRSFLGSYLGRLHELLQRTAQYEETEGGV